MSRYDYRDPGTDPDYCDRISAEPDDEREDEREPPRVAPVQAPEPDGDPEECPF